MMTMPPETKASDGAKPTSPTALKPLPHLDILDATLRAQVQQLATDYAPSKPTLAALLTYFHGQQQQQQQMNTDGPDNKKRKLQASTPTATSMEGQWLFSLRDVAFQQPRKKLDLAFYDSHLRLITRDPEPQIERIISFTDIFELVCVPTPNKPKPHYTCILLLQPWAVIGDQDQQIYVWGFTEDKPALDINGPEPVTSSSGSSNLGIMRAAFQRVLPSHSFSEPSAQVFRSRREQLSANKEPRLYADAYLKAKEGHLYFMKSGILFGFKKPILYFPRALLVHLQMESVTSRNFDLRVHYRLVAGGPVQEMVFSMITVEEFDELSAYAQSQRLHRPPSDKEPQQMDQSQWSSPKGKGPATELMVMPAMPGFGGDDDDDDDDEEDSDYVLEDSDSDVPEEFDSEYESEGEGDQAGPSCSGGDIDISEDDEEDDEEDEEDAEISLGEEDD
jgi:hypothetical protein